MADKTNGKYIKPTKAQRLADKKVLKEAFPEMGKVRVPQIAAHLGIGASTWWLWVKEGRVLQPVKYGARVAVWDAEYIRELAANGIPVKPQVAA